jgi:hypothetical protein
MRDDLVYLASPFTDPNKKVQHDRAVAAAKTAAFLRVIGFRVYSPIAANYFMSQHMKYDATSIDWWDMDKPMLFMSSKLFILDIPGWVESEGICREFMNFFLHKADFERKPNMFLVYPLEHGISISEISDPVGMLESMKYYEELKKEDA